MDTNVAQRGPLRNQQLLSNKRDGDFTAQLKQQAAQIQKVAAHIEISKLTLIPRDESAMVDRLRKSSSIRKAIQEERT
jgi:hypothetical protein